MTASASTASATASDIPADARAATADGAQKFAAYWISRFNTAVKTADPSAIINVSNPGCPVCQGFIAEVNNLQAHGQRAAGDVWTVKSSDIVSFDNAANAVVIVTIHQNEVPRVDNSGSEVGRYVERTDDFAFTLVHNGSTWQTARLQKSE